MVKKKTKQSKQFLKIIKSTKKGNAIIFDELIDRAIKTDNKERRIKAIGKYLESVVWLRVTLLPLLNQKEKFELIKSLQNVAEIIDSKIMIVKDGKELLK